MLARLASLLRPKPPAPPRIPQGMRLYALSDIHGRAALFEKALNWIAQDARKHPDSQVIEVLMGDFIDRGSQSKQVLELACAAPARNHQRICLKGNHEATLLRFLQDAKHLRQWMNFGGLSTLNAYGIELPQHANDRSFEQIRQQFSRELPPEHLTFLQNLQSHYQLGDYYFAHAGVRPNVPLSDQSEEDLLWIRSAFLNHKKPFEKMIIHGHTPQAQPSRLPNRINLDVNEAAEDMLACLVLQDDTQHIELIKY